MGTCTRLRRAIDMLTAVGFAIGFVLTIGIFLAIAMRHDNTLSAEQHRIITEFQDMLNHRLKEHNPRVQVWLANNDMMYRPYARIVAHGHVFFTRAGTTEEMRAKADEAAIFFAKKQLMKWIPND